MALDFELLVHQVSDKVKELDSYVRQLEQQFSTVKEDVRVTKHDLKNVQQTLIGFALRIDKMEERLGQKMDDLRSDLGNLSIKHEKGVSFFAGISFIVVGCAATLMAIGKLFFGG